MANIPDFTIHSEPAPNILDLYSKGLALRDMVSQVGLRNQQIQQSQAQTADLQNQAAIRARGLADQQTLQTHILAHQGDPDPMGAALREVQGTVSPEYFNTVSEGHQKTIQALAAGNKEKLADYQAHLGQFDNMLEGVRKLDPEQIPTEYNEMLNRAQADPALAPYIQKGLENGVIPKTVTADSNDPGLLALHATVVGRKGQLDEASKLAETNKASQDAAKAAQEAQNLRDQNPGIVADSGTKVSHAPVAKAIDAATLANPDLLTPEQAKQQKNAEAQIQNAAGNLHVNQARLSRESAKQQMEMGPDTAQTWVNVLKNNPDAVKEVPPLVKNKVATMFQQQTGLPIPTPASSASVASEVAGRNVLDNAKYILEDIKDPDVQKRLGVILGNLGGAEQKLGTAIAGLSPQAAEKAQDLRTRMKYFNLQEAKTVIGGRMPQKLVEMFANTSPRTNMDEPELRGAVSGVVGAAYNTLDNVDKERFGGQARPRVLRGLTPGMVKPDPRDPTKQIASDDGGKTVYDPATGTVIPR